MAQGDDGVVVLDLGQLVRLQKIQNEHDAGRGARVPDNVNEQVPDSLLDFLGGTKALNGLPDLLELACLQDGDDGLEGLELGGNLLLGKQLSAVQLLRDKDKLLNNLIRDSDKPDTVVEVNNVSGKIQ